MGILSGIVNIAGKVAGAFTPKREEPHPEPVQIMIVEGRQKTRKEQVSEWMNGGDEPDHIQRIRERASGAQKISIGGQEMNIENFSHGAQRQILGEMKFEQQEEQKQEPIRKYKQPETLMMNGKTVRTRSREEIIKKGKQEVKSIMQFMGYRPGKVGKTGKRQRQKQPQGDIQVRAMRSGSRLHSAGKFPDLNVNGKFDMFGSGSGKKKKNFWE